MAEQGEKKRRFCPYCDAEITVPDGEYCEVCEVTVFHCPSCRKPVPREKRVCPHCGAEIKGEDAKV